MATAKQSHLLSPPAFMPFRRIEAFGRGKFYGVYATAQMREESLIYSNP
ncbi:MAG: hypothetical protein WA970_08230 [Gammaproteobacteria bacterium]|jgi:hypothetical protein